MDIIFRNFTGSRKMERACIHAVTYSNEYTPSDEKVVTYKHTPGAFSSDSFMAVKCYYENGSVVAELII